MAVRATSQRILVTGASRGIGRATAEALAARGERVVLAARNVDALDAVVRGIHDRGGHAECLHMDVTSDSSVDAAIDTLLAGGPCDVVINNAGVCEQRAFLAQSPTSQRNEMEVNYWGAVRTTRALLPAMLARGKGHIVNVSSLLGSIGAPSTANYCGTKAALEAWSQGLRGEVEPKGVFVTVFVVPHTDTEMGRRVRFEGVRSLPLRYTVGELIRAVDRRPRRYAASPVYRMLLRLNRWLPGLMEARLARSGRPALDG